jgi:hypothetical protein
MLIMNSSIDNGALALMTTAIWADDLVEMWVKVKVKVKEGICKLMEPPRGLAKILLC